MNNNFWPDLGTTFKQCRYLLLAGMAFAVLGSNPAIAIDNSYLNQLDSEAADSATSSDSAERTKLKQQKFEQILKSERPSTFKLYSRLNDEHKIEVVEDYAQKKRLSRSGGLIAELYFQEK